LWGIPAGLVELGESISGTLVREAREEMNVDIAPRELLGVFTGPDFFHTYADGNQVQIASTLFRADIVGGELKPDGLETLDLRWFDPANLPEAMLARHKRLVRFALSQ
jgi:8-oxo-dGTP pyrophosphatase MutT (NUDIX family)